MSWKPGGRRWDLAQLSHRLTMLKEGDHYLDSLAPGPKERHVFSSPEYKTAKGSIARKVLEDMPFSDRTRRDFAYDYSNPRDELPKFAKFVDQVPTFDRPALTMIRPLDEAAHQQIQMVIQGRSSYIIEENKFNKELDQMDNSLDPQPDSREGDRIMEYRKRRDLEFQAEQDTTAQL